MSLQTVDKPVRAKSICARSAAGNSGAWPMRSPHGVTLCGTWGSAANRRDAEGGSLRRIGPKVPVASEVRRLWVSGSTSVATGKLGANGAVNASPGNATFARTPRSGGSNRRDAEGGSLRRIGPKVPVASEVRADPDIGCIIVSAMGANGGSMRHPKSAARSFRRISQSLTGKNSRTAPAINRISVSVTEWSGRAFCGLRSERERMRETLHTAGRNTMPA
jgi:hypothetical protein